MIVDAHVHVGEWDHADFLGRGCTLDETLAEMKSAGVSGVAIMPTDRCDNQGLFEQAKRAAGGGCALWMFPWVRPGTADLAWVERHKNEVTGIKVHPSLSRLRITDDAFKPTLEVARDANLIVLVHCGRWQEMASYRFAIEAAEAFPTVRFLLAHAGGDTPPLASGAADLVAERRVKNVWFDFSGLREYWVIERNAKKIGADRYLMASDYCLAHPRMYIGAVEAMKLDARDKQKILGENARELFGTPIGGRV